MHARTGVKNCAAAAKRQPVDREAVGAIGTDEAFIAHIGGLLQKLRRLPAVFHDTRAVSGKVKAAVGNLTVKPQIHFMLAQQMFAAPMLRLHGKIRRLLRL